MARPLLSAASQSFAAPGDAGNAELARVAVAADPAVNPDVLLDGFKPPEVLVFLLQLKEQSSEVEPASLPPSYTFAGVRFMRDWG